MAQRLLSALDGELNNSLVKIKSAGEFSSTLKVLLSSPSSGELSYTFNVSGELSNTLTNSLTVVNFRRVYLY